ncbi:phage tail terminator protein [Beggiatoa leptomitoformis]|uniref:Uncharacterized protein n=1 Tax=Beggiatoa leptomitoformis TaxID=288004 RepID=A0A2N9YI19_9GAMM|nr:hypothetical protein [Beggiatoa leptomitoformis]ALG67873.1 hypothetical protein AL038_09320 [Beggiatoa leptomitoformis]AUI69866.1 hypothetical protein BLE401_14980 [Beggiatoa leptomitoformis]
MNNCSRLNLPRQALFPTTFESGFQPAAHNFWFGLPRLRGDIALVGSVTTQDTTALVDSGIVALVGSVTAEQTNLVFTGNIQLVGDVTPTAVIAEQIDAGIVRLVGSVTLIEPTYVDSGVIALTGSVSTQDTTALVDSGAVALVGGVTTGSIIAEDSIVRQQIVLKLKEITDFLEVSGVANLKAGADNVDNMPSAYVFESGVTATDNQAATGVLQTVSTLFVIILMIENNTDDFGSDSSDQMNQLRAQVMSKLLGFKPIGQVQRLEYRGGRVYDFTDDILVWQEHYLLPYTVISDRS